MPMSKEAMLLLQFEKLISKANEERQWFDSYDNSDGRKNPVAYKRLVSNKRRAQLELFMFVHETYNERILDKLLKDEA